MVVGWNLYNGWYGSGFEGFGKYLDKHHELLPDKPLLVTEYGAGHDPRLTSSAPERFDFTAEYAMQYHKVYIDEMEKRDFVAGGLIWALNDFSSEGRGDAVPHINNKGLCDIYRVPKESYWFYKSIWCNEPFAQVWTPYPGILISGNPGAETGEQTKQAVKIYTNIDSLNIFLNGTDMGCYHSESGLLEAILPLRDGENTFDLANANGLYSEEFDFDFLSDPGTMPANAGDIDLHISSGDHRYFWDDSKQELWLPDRPYTPGSWGYIGGESLKVKTRHGVKPSSDHQIFDTSLDPLFQTQQLAPQAYRFDLPPGNYKVTLLFAELSSSSESENLAYNLGDDVVTDKLQDRVFSVQINGDEVLDFFNIFEVNGSFGAVSRSHDIEVKGEEGLYIEFIKESGDPVISGIEIHSMISR